MRRVNTNTKSKINNTKISNLTPIVFVIIPRGGHASTGYGWPSCSLSAEQEKYLEFGLAKRVRPSRPVPSRPASARTFFTSRLNLMLTYGSSRFPRQRPFIYLCRQPPSEQPRVYPVTQMRTDGVHCRESAVTGPAVLKVVRVTGVTFTGCHEPIFVRLSFPTPTKTSVIQKVLNDYITASF